MTTFFSFIKQHKIPPRHTLGKLLTPPLTWFAVVLYALVGSILIIGYILILQWNSRFLVTVPAHGGTLVEGVIGAPHVINPVTATTPTDIGLTDLVYGGLVKQAGDGSSIPLLAASYAVSPDGRTYTFTLRNNLKWSDGKPLASSDVAFTVAKLADPALRSDPYWQDIVVNTPDPRTVVFNLPEARTDFLAHASIGIIPEHIWGDISDDAFESAPENTRPVGSGPYKVRRLISHNDIPTEIVLERNPRYALSLPYIGQYRMVFFANQYELADALNNGSIDMTLAADPATAAALHNGAYRMQKIASPATITLFVLQNNPPNYSKDLFSILDRAIDKNALLATVENGYGILPDDASTAPLAPDGTLALLQPLGYTMDNGILEKNGTPVTFSIAVENDPELLLAARTLASQVGRLGILVNVKAFDRGTFQDAIGANQYQLFLGTGREPSAAYEPALVLYTKAYPFITKSTAHISLPDSLDSPTDRYRMSEQWYVRTNDVWRIFAKHAPIINL